MIKLLLLISGSLFALLITAAPIFLDIVVHYVIFLCKEGAFMCQNGQCISTSWRCDRVDDCGENSDEREWGMCYTRLHMIPIAEDQIILQEMVSNLDQQ